MENKHLILIAVLIAAIILFTILIIGGLNNTPTETLRINDINIEQDQYGLFVLIGHITPLKDFDYLEARVVFYDDQGTIIGSSACAWNMLDLKKGDNISLGKSPTAVVDGTPAYAVVGFYDSISADEPVANATITFNGNVSNDTGAVVSSSSDGGDDKLYTQQDLDDARDEGYADGYADSSDFYSDDSDYADDSIVNNPPSVDEEGNLVYMCVGGFCRLDTNLLF